MSDLSCPVLKGFFTESIKKRGVSRIGRVDSREAEGANLVTQMWQVSHFDVFWVRFRNIFRVCRSFITGKSPMIDRNLS